MLQSLNTSYSDLSCMFVKAKKEEKKKGMFEMQAFKHAKWDYLKSKLLKAWGIMLKQYRKKDSNYFVNRFVL